MKSQILTIVFIATTIVAFAQKNVVLRVHHLLAGQPFAFNQASSNNLGNGFNLSRLEYYVSSIKVKHDGGMTMNATDVYALVKANSTSTDIDLSSLSVNTIEGIAFSIGVNAPQNNQDPTQWASGHPLAPKSPSMHWGWTAGYRFVAMEGKTGTNLNTVFEIHALGNVNYFEQTINTTATQENGKWIINVYADYAQSLRGIAISQGVISHGETGEAATLLTNFKTNVFKASSVTGMFEQNLNTPFVVYPNPSTGKFSIDLSQLPQVNKIVVNNILGQNVLEQKSQSSSEINLTAKGIYIVSLFDNNNLVGTRKLVVE
ncbi:MAG: MbnP family protein [Bacteroidota bacterium]|jgi:hypothetical protein